MEEIAPPTGKTLVYQTNSLREEQAEQVALHNRKKEQLLFEYTQLAVELKKNKKAAEVNKTKTHPPKWQGAKQPTLTISEFDFRVIISC